ncbi:MAG: 30S ribosomal protein S7 [Candidatus Magasanikbacteria bacterium GW2011_GWC2_37_14]|uniref:Small ribosomal subunit protein uS7 n=1 Tax=Candidatus Magasanikbacteria bacterium GW2011_GWC2_37_14 TaxID=1619046 RepID=A0A0G0IRI6_9BACT|nr:MAG: 30S ribosomal protein S7 [Candidatus Magasanikbacteria bacterium GW2011_GWC2_37_14]
MPRGRSIPKRVIAPDPNYHNVLLNKFINMVMYSGKKTTAQKIVYGALDILAEKKGGDAIKLFEQVIETIRPSVEVRSRRVGGANYQVPMPVPVSRQNALAFRWIINATREKKGTTMQQKLATEMLDILAGVGGSIKKKEDVMRMAEANKAFAHFARR